MVVETGLTVILIITLQICWIMEWLKIQKLEYLENKTNFLRNKIILNLCLRWHTLRSYHFAAEVTFNEFFSELLVIVYQFCLSINHIILQFHGKFYKLLVIFSSCRLVKMLLPAIFIILLTCHLLLAGDKSVLDE